MDREPLYPVQAFEGLLDFLWDSLPHAMAILTDSDLNIIRSNAQFQKETGFTEQQLKGSAFSRFIEPSVIAKPFPTRNNPSQLQVVKVRKADGGLIEADMAISEINMQSAGILHVAVMYNTGPIRNHHLLQQFALTFLKDETLGVILLQPDFGVSDISPLACRILEVNKQDVVGRSMDSLFNRRPFEHRLLKQMVIEEIPVRNHPLRWTQEDEICELLMDANLLRDEEERLLGAYVIFKDVSNLRSLEEQVQRSDRLSMIGQIAAGTAHEIRNPLTAIKGFLQMFKSRLKEKGLDKEHGYTEIMLTEINRINDLVSEFLLLSKPKDIVYDLIELGSVLRDIMPIVGNEALLHGITVRYDPEVRLPKVIADRELLKQVFLNICKNGIEAMEEGGTLTVGGRIEREFGFGRWVHIDIHDTGPGIPQSIVEKIFDPFVTTKQNGTGLGLSVCQRIIHDMGGGIRVSTKGTGTTFTVSIPCSVDEKQTLHSEGR
ncbi:ATP-binding protein [Paenibacillus tarimensis]